VLKSPISYLATFILQLHSYPDQPLDIELQDSSLTMAAFNNYTKLYDFILSRYMFVFKSRPPNKPDLTILATSPDDKEQWVHFFATLLALVCNDDYNTVQVPRITQMDIMVQAGLMELIQSVNSRGLLEVLTISTDNHS
jgi:hypothetical protein